MLTMRDTLFGDADLSEWPSGVTAVDAEPWSLFVTAWQALERGDRDTAISNWQQIVAMPGLESRHYAQAWHFLRAQGVKPDASQAKKLLGVVLEVGMEQGLDLLAAYPERHARYYNFSGAGVVWEHPDDRLDAEIDRLLSAGQRVLNAIGPWDRPRLPAPTDGQVRLNFLSPSGLHFGQGSFQQLMGDAMGKTVIDAGVALMQKMIAIDEELRAKR